MTYARFDSRSPMEKRFINTDCNKTDGGLTMCVRVGQDHYIRGLSRDQADAVWKALRIAQEHAVKSTQNEIRRALGMENVNV